MLLTGGLGLVLLGLCYELVDRRGWRRVATPFVMLGSNALAYPLVWMLPTVELHRRHLFRV